MAPLKIGDKFPSDVVFQYVPVTNLDPRQVGLPQSYNASKEWAGKKVVLVSVPGAFTPGCQGYHIPPYIEKLKAVKGKGVDIVAVIAFNDAWVMAAWSKVNGVKEDDFLFMADTETQFAKKIGWMAGKTERNGRWAMVIDKEGTIIYAEKEPNPSKVTVSGVEAVLAKL